MDILRRLMSSEVPDHAIQVARLLNLLTLHSDRHASATVISATVVRYDGTHFWLMNKPDTGWGEFGIPYKTIWQVAAQWRLRFTGIGTDTHSFFYTVEPQRKEDG